MTKKEGGGRIKILLVEDNPGDVRLTQEALKDAKVLNDLYIVNDGVEAMEFLFKKGKYANAVKPDLILLDLNLPKKDGREVLAEIKDDDNVSKLLHKHLISSLPKNATFLDSLLIRMGKMGYGMQLFAGKSLGDVLLDAKTDTGVLQPTKTDGKMLTLTADSEKESAVAVTIYYAAIAGALVHHKEKISSSSYDMLDKSFSLLLSKKWLTPELRNMFSIARTICQTKQKEQ